MNEQEWRKCAEPSRMLWFVQGRVAEREFRLFNCACCRRIWRLLTDERSRHAVEVAERHADGVADDRELDTAYDAAASVPGDPISADSRVQAAFAALTTAAPLVGAHYGVDVPDAAASAVHYEAFPQALTRGAGHLPPPGIQRAESAAQTGLLRDIIGNPFRPVSLAPAWRTPDVLRLAQAAYYDNRLLPSGLLDTGRLAVLADALEEAGCDNPDLLSHCRQPGEHVRGCWVVDLLLGKT